MDAWRKLGSHFQQFPLRLLQRLYAQLLQEQAFGGLTAAVLKELDSVSPEAGKGRAPTPPPPRHGHQIRLVIAGEGRASKPASKPAPKPEPQRDAKLAALLAEAYAARQLVLDNPETPLADLAKQHGKCRKHLARMVELSCLAPDIVTAILEGKQPRSLSAASLRSRQLPLSWEEQRAALLEAWIRCLHPA